ncbi:MAG: S41 family peptidase [Alistipes sp.]|nr:S41 family peptidase [Alistipes sp.]
MKKSRRLSLVSAVLTFAGVAAANGSAYAQNDDFELVRNVETVVNMMRELSVGYVDPISPDVLMSAAAEGMTDRLDPYTGYMSEEEMKQFEQITTGKYGGIGAVIRLRGDYVIIAEPYKDSPADRAGLKAGDKIVAINGEDARGFTTEQVSNRLKGDPNTNVKVTVERLADGEVVTHKIKRERISMPGVTYAGWLADGIGVICHSDFTEGCYDEMRAAIEQLRSEDELKGLVLDYRNNGGGFLSEAIKILSLFVPKGTETVTVRGRNASDEQVYRTPFEPLLPELPLVVLVNGNTASSSEIVAGTLQDIDRAVLIGSKSFGKGLVQSTVPVGYGAYVKMTTAKYYIPSGRCIQNIDYSSHDDNVHEVPDSLVNEFSTRNGRKVYDGGGIMPDVRVEEKPFSRFALTLYAMGYIDEFCDRYVASRPNLNADSRSFAITDADYDDFTAYVLAKEVPYTSATRYALRQLRTAVDADRYDDRIGALLEQMENSLNDDTASNMRTYRDDIVNTIESGIVRRLNYSAGVIERELLSSPEVAAAVELLRDPARYADILENQDTVKK